jgi:4-hydroxythreonine-4-phosphate dehydrogenase
MTQPLIAVTMGDPAGIGPEIIARTFDEGGFQNRAIVVGDAGILERAARLLTWRCAQMSSQNQRTRDSSQAP